MNCEDNRFQSANANEHRFTPDVKVIGLKGAVKLCYVTDKEQNLIQTPFGSAKYVHFNRDGV